MKRLFATLAVAFIGYGCATLDVPTPMPPVVNVVAPGPEIPAHVAAFSGIWTGQLDPPAGATTGSMYQSLVVQSITAVDPAQYEVQLIASWGDGWGLVRKPYYLPLIAVITSDGVLRLRFAGGTTTYTLSADRRQMSSEFARGGSRVVERRGTLSRTDHFPVK